MSHTDHRQLSAFEATSFMNKFKDLWQAGQLANLYFETEAGQAWATIRVALGSHPLNTRPHQHHDAQQEQPHVRPAQLRRRARREDARAAGQAAEATHHLPPDSIAEEAIDVETNTEQDIVAVTAAEGVTTNTNSIVAEQAAAVKDYPCDLCERTFGNLKGLRAHTGKQHKPTNSPIPQLDGAVEFVHEPTYCKICKECHPETKTSEDLDYHVMNNHETTSVYEAYGHEWVHQRTYCIRRGSPFFDVFHPH